MSWADILPQTAKKYEAAIRIRIDRVLREKFIPSIDSAQPLSF